MFFRLSVKRVPLLLTALACATGILACNGGPSAAAAESSGQSGSSFANPTAFLPEFGIRDARTCNPLKTKPTAAQIPTLIQCYKDNHNSTDFVTIYEDVKVETGAMRPYNFKWDGHYSGIDTEAKLLSIRGTMTSVGCMRISNAPGKNCIITVNPTAEGDCFKTTFGDWKCDMYDDHPQPKQQEMPPPPRS